MVVARYAGIGEICPLWNIAVSDDGAISTAGTLYFSFQLQNRAGYNIGSVSEAIAYTTGQQITITIPESVQQPGWDIHYFILSAGTTPDPGTFIQIARVPGYQWGLGIEPQSLRTLLPVDIVLSHDSHIALAPSVPTLADLPTGVERLDGQIRWVTAEAKFFEYRADSTLTLSIDVIAADVGQWVRVGSASTYVSDTTSGMGCDRTITSINPATVIPTPPYPGQAASNSKVLPAWEEQLWIYNNDTNVLPAGHEFGIELEYNNKRSPDLLSGLFLIKFKGFVNTATGAIRTTTSTGVDFPNCGGYFSWTPRITTLFVTSDDLQLGEAIALAVKPFFSNAELNNQVTPGSLIGVLPSIRTQSGDYNPLGKFVPGGAVFNIGDRYRVVPNTGLSVDILSGAALVASYDFPEKPRRTISGLLLNTSGQKVVINGNGAVFAESPTYFPSGSEAIRAIVGTPAGESAAGAWSDYRVIAAGQSIVVTLAYPSIIRADYPDVIASSDKGIFNPFAVTIYLQRQDTEEIRSFTGFLVIAGASQEFTITSWADGTVLSALPIAASDFSLFAPSIVTLAIDTGGNFPTTSYRAAYSFVYDGAQITSISHNSPPCIQEWQGDFTPSSISVGSVTEVAYGSPLTIVNSGTSSQVILDFAIPQGPPGEQGPPGQGSTGGKAFGGETICTNGCLLGGKAFKFYAAQSTLEIKIEPGFDINITAGSDSIQVHRWNQQPNTNLIGRQFVLALPNTGGSAIISIDSTYRWISFFARNPAMSGGYDGVCFTTEGNTITLISF